MEERLRTKGEGSKEGRRVEDIETEDREPRTVERTAEQSMVRYIEGRTVRRTEGERDIQTE